METVRLLLGGRGGSGGVEVDRGTKDDGTTPLFLATFAELARVLIEHGADVNKARHSGATPLFMAAQNGFVELTELLIENGADINQANSNWETPVNVAADNGHVAVVRVLLQTSADTTIKNKWGRDPLASARKNDHREVAALDAVSILSIPVSLRRGTGLGLVWHRSFF